MNKMYLALALLFVGAASNVLADANIASYINRNYCSGNTGRTV